VASHPWIRQQGLLKVGFSADLSKRLRMNNYTTCFSDEWRYEAVIMCKRIDARLLEFAVLRVLADLRVANRELVRADLETLMSVAEHAVSALGLKAKRLDRPTFNPPGPKSKAIDLIGRVPSTMKKKYDAVSKTLSCAVENLFLRRDTMAPKDVLEASLTLKSSVTSANEFAPLLTPSGAPHSKTSVIDEDEEEECIRETIDVEASPRELFSMVSLRDYQEEAVARVWREIRSSGRAIVQMACRSGKTPVAHRLLTMTAQEVPNGRYLFLVPGLALLRQTACKMVAYGLPQGMNLLLIGSDPTGVHLPNESVTHMTTDIHEIETAVENAPVLAICTYASSHLLQQVLDVNRRFLDLTVFDEAHRVCGKATPSAFNTMLLAPPAGKRVFLTATPTYDTPIRMDNAELFGGIAYRFYLRDGVDRGFVNDFGVEVVLGDSAKLHTMVLKAMSSVNKLLVFCKNIRHAEELHDAVRRYGGNDHECLIAHSRLGPRAVSGALNRFRIAARAVLFNVRLFQEGVEVPDLNGVFFAAPRYSPRDIIQSICRPLNKLHDKPPSTIFLPAHFDASLSPDAPPNLASFSTLVPYTDALMDEDPSLFEYLIDPAKHNYRLRVVGVRELKTSDSELQKVVLPSIRRGVRYSRQHTDRLHRAERLPWKLAFAELKRVVTVCNRYPKVNDAWIVGDARVPMHAFYKHCREGYMLFLNGMTSFLEKHQLRDLEALPCWTTYGIQGPYPWAECMQTLRLHLEKHRAFPLLDIHRGGYVGLEATPYERLAGALCNINQQERHEYLAVSQQKQRDLDDLCANYGLTWRKPRNSKGVLTKGARSAITDCYDEFKRSFGQRDPEFMRYLQVHFPGYPDKHKFMENIEVQRSGAAPPRLKVRSEVQIKRMRRKGVEDLRQHVVVCRQCRVEVHASDWKLHVASPGHQARLV
jgi:superfamily II DNA or RNA helicase